MTPLSPTLARDLEQLVRSRIDHAIADVPGSTLTSTDAGRILDDALALIPDAPAAAKDYVRNVARRMGLEQLLARRGVDETTLKRSLSTASSSLSGVAHGGSVADVVDELGLATSSSDLIDRARTGDEPPATEEIARRIETAEAALTSLDRDLPSVNTAKLAEAEIPADMAAARDKSWALYGQVKGALEAGRLDVAEALLELAAAHGLDYLYQAAAYGDDAAKLEKKRAQNRLGMITHQFGALAEARGDLAGRRSAEVKALAWYRDATSGENVGHYHPAAFMNILCSYGQLGQHDLGMQALDDLFASCKDEAQKDQMRGFLEGDAETMALYGDRADFRRSLGID